MFVPFWLDRERSKRNEDEHKATLGHVLMEALVHAFDARTVS